MKNRYTIFIIYTLAFCLQTAAGALAGEVIHNHDEWTLWKESFSDTDGTAYSETGADPQLKSAAVLTFLPGHTFQQVGSNGFPSLQPWGNVNRFPFSEGGYSNADVGVNNSHWRKHSFQDIFDRQYAHTFHGLNESTSINLFNDSDFSGLVHLDQNHDRNLLGSNATTNIFGKGLFNVYSPSVPIPASLVLLASGLIIMIVMRKRLQKYFFTHHRNKKATS